MCWLEMGKHSNEERDRFASSDEQKRTMDDHGTGSVSRQALAQQKSNVLLVNCPGSVAIGEWHRSSSVFD